MNDDRLNKIDTKLHYAKFMAKFANELVGHLDGNGAAEGHFQIPESDGNRLDQSDQEARRDLNHSRSPATAGLLFYTTT